MTDSKDPKKVAAGRKGGKATGNKGTKLMSPEKRREIALKGASARWSRKNVPTSTMDE